MKKQYKLLMFSMIFMFLFVSISSAQNDFSFNYNDDNFAFNTLSDKQSVENILLKSNSVGQGSSFWNRSSGNVYPSSLSDNVGIGTSTPNSKLDVNGEITTDGIQTSEIINFSSVFGAGIRTDNEPSMFHNPDELAFIAGGSFADMADSTLVAIGYQAGEGSSGGGYVSIGAGATSTNAGSNYVSIGASSGTNTGSDFVSLGYNSGQGAGNQFTATGYRAGRGAGNQFTATGYGAGDSAGSNFVATGYRAGQSAGSGFAALGHQAGRAGGGSFVSIGSNSGQLSGGDFVALGHRAGVTPSANNYIAIGQSAADAANTPTPLTGINGFITLGQASAPQYDGHFLIQQASLGDGSPAIQANLSSDQVGINLSNGADLNHSLEVEGTTMSDVFKIDNSTLPTCNTNTEGEIRYNGTAHYGCNSTKWNAMY